MIEITRDIPKIYEIVAVEEFYNHFLILKM